MKTPITSQGLPPLLDDLAKWEDQVRRYDALGACNPLANTLQQAREALAAQAASVEPVGEVMEGIQTVGFGRKEIQKFAQFDQSLPVGTKLYASAPPAHIPADAPVWNSIQIASWIGSQLMHEPAMFERSTVCKFVRSLGRHPTLLKHSPQPQAVDAVDEQREALRMGVECLRNWKILHPEDFDDLDERAVALLKAALATTKEAK